MSEDRDIPLTPMTVARIERVRSWLEFRKDDWPISDEPATVDTHDGTYVCFGDGDGVIGVAELVWLIDEYKRLAKSERETNELSSYHAWLRYFGRFDSPENYETWKGTFTR